MVTVTERDNVIKNQPKGDVPLKSCVISTRFVVVTVSSATDVCAPLRHDLSCEKDWHGNKCQMAPYPPKNVVLRLTCFQYEFNKTQNVRHLQCIRNNILKFAEPI